MVYGAQNLNDKSIVERNFVEAGNSEGRVDFVKGFGE